MGDVFGESTKSGQTLTNITVTELALDTYKAEFGDYPHETQVWSELANEGMVSEYDLENYCVDGWGRRFECRIPGTHRSVDI